MEVVFYTLTSSHVLLSKKNEAITTITMQQAIEDSHNVATGEKAQLSSYDSIRQKAVDIYNASPLKKEEDAKSFSIMYNFLFWALGIILFLYILGFVRKAINTYHEKR